MDLKLFLSSLVVQSTSSLLAPPGSCCSSIHLWWSPWAVFTAFCTSLMKINPLNLFYKVRNPTVFEQWQCKCYAWHKYKPYRIIGYFCTMIISWFWTCPMAQWWYHIKIPLYFDLYRGIHMTFQGTSEYTKVHLQKSTILDMYYGTLTYTIVFMWHSWVFPNIPWYMSKKNKNVKIPRFWICTVKISLGNNMVLLFYHSI